MSNYTAPLYDAVVVSQLFGLESQKVANLKNPPKPEYDFLTFFDPGLSIIQMRTALKGKDVFEGHKQSWYNQEEFANKEEIPCYRKLCMTPIVGSYEKFFAEQQKLLLACEGIPLARVVLTAMAIHSMVSKRKTLFDDSEIRCLDVCSDDSRPTLSFSHLGRIDLSSCPDDYSSEDLCLARCLSVQAL